MSLQTTAGSTGGVPSAAPIVLERAAVRSWKPPIGLGIFAVLALLLFTIGHREGSATFRLSTDSDVIQLPPIIANVQLVTIVAIVLLFLIAALSAVRSYRAEKTPAWLIGIYAFVLLAAFLTWAAAGAFIPIPGLLVGAVGLSVPLVFGALGGVISERVGVVNVAIEGQLLAGAFVSAVVASITQNPFLGLLGAIVAGVLVSFVLATFSIKYIVDQVIVGVVLNVLVVGLTSFLFSKVLAPNAELLNSPPRFPRLPIPILGEIPIIGPVLFRQTIIVYLVYIAVAVVWFALFKTKWGLRLRAVGEHPQAADTVGIRVGATRFWNVSLAGAIAGLGGAYLTLASVPSFTKDVTSGAGFIALAAVIFGQWNPVKATLAALLFGFATNLQNVLGIVGSAVPQDFLLMLPYVVTIFAVAGLVGQVRGPAAAGKPYVKG